MLGNGLYMTTTLEKALNYAKVKDHGGAIFQLHGDLGECYNVKHKDRLMQQWQNKGYDSACSGPGVNGVREEHCVADPNSRVRIERVILGNTREAKMAGYEVLPNGRLVCSK